MKILVFQVLHPREAVNNLVRQKSSPVVSRLLSSTPTVLVEWVQDGAAAQMEAMDGAQKHSLPTHQSYTNYYQETNSEPQIQLCP